MLSDPNYPASDHWSNDYNFCLCAKDFDDEPSDGEKDPRAYCFEQEYATCTSTQPVNDELTSCVVRQKRSVERHFSNIERLFELSNKQFSERAKKVVKVHLLNAI